MEISVKPGKYVVAVSGGVDSLVLLDLLSKLKGVELIVAHINEGLRKDSSKVQKMVGKIAKSHGLAFYTTNAGLKSPAEALGRKVRYQFLEKARADHKADAIITAHHQDDLLETAILNLLRGTGRRGLSSLKSHKHLIRPLLKFTKAEIYNYAQSNHLTWHEDPMNQDTKFLRNYVRHEILPNISESNRREMITSIDKLGVVNEQIDQIIEPKLKNQKINRKWFINLPNQVAQEVVAAWLRLNNISFDSKTLNRLTVAAKTLSAGKQADVNRHRALKIEQDYIKLL